MMNTHVNLLRESEMRHQGIVSRKFMVVASVGAAAAVAVLLLALGVARFYNRGQTIKTARKTWAEAEPRYQRLLTLQEAHAQQKALADELLGWRHSRLELSALLAEIRRVAVARPIQFIRLSASSQIEVIQPPAPPPKMAAPPAKPSAAKGGEDLAPPPPGTPARRFRMLIEGKAQGEQAYQEVVGLVNDLRAAPALAALFESVRLQGLRQAADTKDRPTERLFEIECLLLPRKIE